jgi:hypothetical protein
LVVHRAIATSSASRHGNRHGANGLPSRLDDFERIEDARAEAIESGKDQSVNIAERDAFRPLALQQVQLVPEHKDLSRQCRPRPKQPDQSAPEQLAKIAHRSQASTDLPLPPIVLGFRQGQGIRGSPYRLVHAQVISGIFAQGQSAFRHVVVSKKPGSRVPVV